MRMLLRDHTELRRAANPRMPGDTPISSVGDNLAVYLLLVTLLVPFQVVGLAASERTAEDRIIEYLKDNLKPGSPVVVSKLHNEVFTSPEERKALDRLYNIVF